jgi:hypothetical protein
VQRLSAHLQDGTIKKENIDGHVKESIIRHSSLLLVLFQENNEKKSEDG